MGKFSIKVIGGGVFLKNKPQTITITWEIKDEDGVEQKSPQIKSLTLFFDIQN